MSNIILSKLAIATAGVVLSLATISTKPSQAATIRYRFDVYDVEGPNNEFFESGFGFFNYENSSISGIELETVPVSDLSFILNGMPQLTGPDCCNGQDRVETVSFLEGEILGLTYSRYRTFSILGKTIDFSYPGQGPTPQGKVRYTLLDGAQPPKSVPEGSTTLGLSVLGLGFLVKKKLSRST
ncbi:PEP-CTERM sorting domain-containing protein [Trichocoleus sp. DQ-U1]|uniref:PEP-CTERM sorting domain-containing protein n=1 Tax=Trichocoleus sp. DQ-U1 TaxID=2933926 RepID=UPI0032996E20